MTRFFHCGRSTAILAACFAVSSCAAPPQRQQSLPGLLLPCGKVSLDPAALPAFRAELEAAAARSADGPQGRVDLRIPVADRAVYIFQYDAEKTPSSSVRESVAASGAANLAPVPGGAYLVRATPVQALSILDSGVAAAAREYGASDKVASDAVRGNREDPDAAVWTVALFSDADPEASATAISAVPGVEIAGSTVPFMLIRADGSALASVVALPCVQSAGPWFEPRLDSERPSDFGPKMLQ